jgi:aspartate/methionine/tyrosine aminotransferase|uniref:Aminotransferase n=1 Tax=Desulfomonile tiedjei TaxID=2358 RepID=A0A7C4EVX5_9BACT
MSKLETLISQKSRNIPPFLVMDVLERAVEMERAGEDVIHLEVGEPDFDTPPNIVQAGVEALRAGKTHYTPSVGIHELREAIARCYENAYGVEVDPGCVVVTSGCSPALLLALAAIIDDSSEVILSDPHYACYPNFIRFLGGIPVFVRTTAADGFQMDPDCVKRLINDKTKAILVNSPSNPTGTLLEPERLQALSSLGVLVISDEIYHGLVYEGKERSILEFTDKCFAINGFSKLYAMTGWRLGYIICPPAFVRPLQKMIQNFFISPADFVQWAGLEALTNSSQATVIMKNTFNERRVYMLKRLREIGFQIDVDPTAAFYILADARRFSADSYTFAFDILEQTGVGVAPGIDFGESAEGYIRFSYTNSLEMIKKALDRIELYVRQRFG